MKTAPNTSRSNKSRQLCVLFPGALGDFICCLPAIRRLARGAEVDVFARSEFAAVAPDDVTIRSVERHEIASLFISESRADALLADFFARYETVYSWMGSTQPEFVRRLQAVTKGAARIFPFRPADIDSHQAQYYLRCVGAEEETMPDPVIVPRDEAIVWRRELWARYSLYDRPVLTIAPGSGAREKNWAEDNFLAIAGWWHHRTNGAVVVLLGPVEKERGVSARLRGMDVVAQGLNLAQAVAVLAAGDLYLGNDSGISHLAGASGIRTVALFGPSDPRQWAPLGPKVTVLSRHEACSPCAVATLKSCGHRNCLSHLDAAQVIAALEQLPEIATLTRYRAGIRV